MKKLTPYITHGILAIGILIALHFWQVEKYSRMSAESVTIQKTNEFKIRVTADSIRVASQSAAYLTSANEVSKYYRKELDAVKAELGGKLDRMNSMVRATFLVSTQGKVKTIVERIGSDSVDNFQGSATFSDKHFKIGVFMNKDTTIFNPIQYSATFTAIGFQKKKLFRKDEFYITAYTDDKNSTITGLTNFEVKEFKDKRWGIGPYVGYDPIQNKPSFGIGLHWDLIKF